MPLQKKYNIALIIALVIHVSGLAGMLWGNVQTFAAYTSLNLLIMFLLLIWTQEKPNSHFFLFIAFCFFTGYFAEFIGVHTGVLFGEYNYGAVLGAQYKSIPLIIGVNWFIVIYCVGTTIQLFTTVIEKKLLPEQVKSYKKWSVASIIIDGALLATFFDWVMEPIAVHLGFWSWANGSIPLLNYICWFCISVILLLIFTMLSFHKKNTFAFYLLLIQCMFFLLLRTFLI